MCRMERRVAYGEAPSVAAKGTSHRVVSMKRTPKLRFISMTADDRRVDVLIPILTVYTTIKYPATFIGSVASKHTITFSDTIK